MTIRVGINGVGRMGRLTLRAAWGDPAITFVRINDPAGDAATVAHLLNFDSVHGRRGHEAGADAGALAIGGARIALARDRELAAKDWSDCDVVIADR